MKIIIIVKNSLPGPLQKAEAWVQAGLDGRTTVASYILHPFVVLSATACMRHPRTCTHPSSHTLSTTSYEMIVEAMCVLPIKPSG